MVHGVWGGVDAVAEPRRDVYPGAVAGEGAVAWPGQGGGNSIVGRELTMSMQEVVMIDAEEPEEWSGAETVDVPVVGVIGKGRIERLFCRLAQAYVRDEEMPKVEFCAQARRLFTDEDEEGVLLCGLTGFEHVCLFDAPRDPQWALLREMVDGLAERDA